MIISKPEVPHHVNYIKVAPQLNTSLPSTISASSLLQMYDVKKESAREQDLPKMHFQDLGPFSMTANFSSASNSVCSSPLFGQPFCTSVNPVP